MGCDEYIMVFVGLGAAIGLFIFPVMVLAPLEGITNSDVIGLAIIVWICCELLNLVVWYVTYNMSVKTRPPRRVLPRWFWLVLWLVELVIVQIVLWIPLPPHHR